MRYRVAAAFAGLAFVVALIAGLTGGVHFGTALVRAVAGAAVFAALGGAVMIVIERYLPELAKRPEGSHEREAVEAAEPPESDVRSVDIVLPEENPLAERVAGDLEPADDEEGGSIAASEPEGDLAAVGPEPGPNGAPSAVPPPAETSAGDPAAVDVEAMPSLEGVNVVSRQSPAAGPAHRHGRADAPQVDPPLAARGLRTWLKRDNEG